jgi:hypothetical protein
VSGRQSTENSRSYDGVILGAGYAGLVAALRLGRQKWGLRVALVNSRAQFLERVRLQGSIVAPVTPRIVSISAFFAGTTIEFICGSVTSFNAEQRRIQITTDAQEREIAFDQAIYALGSHVDVDNVPGVSEHAYRLDPGDSPRSAAALRSRLHQSADRPVRVIAVGGGPTAVEAAGDRESRSRGGHQQAGDLQALAHARPACIRRIESKPTWSFIRDTRHRNRPGRYHAHSAPHFRNGGRIKSRSNLWPDCGASPRERFIALCRSA